PNAIRRPNHPTRNGQVPDLRFMRKLCTVTLLMLGVATWVVAVGFGLTWLTRYETASGREAQPPKTWPAESCGPHMAGQPTLLMFVHPRCPCSRASLEELGALVDECSQRAQTCVVLYRPAGSPSGWEKTGLWKQASSLPGVRVFCDADEDE